VTADDGTPSFSLRLQTRPGPAADDPTTVAYGEEIRLSLWNVSTERRHTGVRDKWNLQILTTEGWRDVRGSTDGDPLPYPDLALIHRPGEGLTWTIELTERAILDGHLPKTVSRSVQSSDPAGTGSCISQPPATQSPSSSI
jgi:hypothetical protein